MSSFAGYTEGPFGHFCDELDELIDRWREKPTDDAMSHAEVVGALQFKSLALMIEAQEDADE